MTQIMKNERTYKVIGVAMMDVHKELGGAGFLRLYTRRRWPLVELWSEIT